MDKKLKLVTYNIRNGIDFRHLLRNISKMAAKEVNLFCFQEFRKFREKPFIGKKLKEIFKDDWGLEYFLNEDTFDLGLCVMWKRSELELIKTDKFLLPKVARIRRSTKVIEKVFLTRSLPVQRGAIIADFKMGHHPLRIVNVHLDWIGGKTHKAIQIKQLAEHLKTKVGVSYEVICGDFNTVGPLGLLNKRRHKILGAFEGKFIDVSSRLRLTSYSLQKLDYIFCRGFRAVKVRRSFVLGSDHLPIRANLDL
jgi:endonuclease/exonuclease/phosphatase family metal-dependent hydrolase